MDNRISDLFNLQERCWTAASKLESLVARDGNLKLPVFYLQAFRDAFDSLATLQSVAVSLDGPWRVSGKTEDGRMYKLTNRSGYVVCHAYTEEVARALELLSLLEGPRGSTELT